MINDIYIPSTIAVYGNGKGIGIELNGKRGCIGPGNSGAFCGTAGYNKVSNTALSYDIKGDYSIGLTTETGGQSGIVAKSNSITTKQFVCHFIIKY